MKLAPIYNRDKKSAQSSKTSFTVTERNFVSSYRVKESGGKYSTSRQQRNEGAFLTPPYILQLVIQVLGAIDLDPCAENSKCIPAHQHYTTENNSLKQEWNGRVFINPPQEYAGLWVRKLIVEIELGRVTEAIALVVAATDSEWLSELLATQAVCFWRGQIQFIRADYIATAPTQQPYVLVYWGNNQEKFEQVFKDYGTVHVPTLKKLSADESEISREKLSADVTPFSLEKNLEPLEAPKTSYIEVVSSQSGSLYRYIKNIKLKSGVITSYPRIEGARGPDNLNHWYWGYSYKVIIAGSWKSKSLSISRAKVGAVRIMIGICTSVEVIKDFIKVLGDESEISREKVLGEKTEFSLEKKSASGHLYQYLKNKTLKSGVIASYPRVEGERDPNKLEHWYWGYSYEVLENDEWRRHSLSIPRSMVAPIQAMIDSHKTINQIKSFIEGKP
jgi:hypothetical protein